MNKSLLLSLLKSDDNHINGPQVKTDLPINDNHEMVFAKKIETNDALFVGKMPLLNVVLYAECELKIDKAVKNGSYLKN